MLGAGCATCYAAAMQRCWLSLLILTCVLNADDALDRARRIHAASPVLDSHIDTLQRVLIENVDIGRRLPEGHVDLVRLREGGVSVPFFALWAPTFYKGAEAVRRTLQLRDAMDRVLAAYPDRIELALNGADIDRIRAAHKIAVVLTIEGGHQIAADLAVLRMYHRLGVRSMTLSHFRNNEWADSSTDTPVHNGLTEFGSQVVREMNRIGMIVDISHVSDKTFYDALAVTTKPVIASHSSCRALCNVPRNMTDDMLRALAKNGGVVGINFSADFLNPLDAEGLMKSVNAISGTEPAVTGKELDEYAAKNFLGTLRADHPKGHATIDDAIAHIDHAVKVAGVDHVGIGSDFDGIDTAPIGLEDISKMPELTAALLRRGYSEADVKKIIGGNLLRVLREVTGK
jgi:membrane dipeptidase